MASFLIAHNISKPCRDVRYNEVRLDGHQSHHKYSTWEIETEIELESLTESSMKMEVWRIRTRNEIHFWSGLVGRLVGWLTWNMTYWDGYPEATFRHCKINSNNLIVIECIPDFFMKIFNILRIKKNAEWEMCLEALSFVKENISIC